MQMADRQSYSIRWGSCIEYITFCWASVYLSGVNEREEAYSSDVAASDIESNTGSVAESDSDENLGLSKALDTYRKLVEKKDDDVPLTDEEKDLLEQKINEIKDRDIVEKITDHTPVEIPCKSQKITVGPPTLTRFEKARIMGARALQLSQGAPPFISIPKSARISLDISMEELEQRVIPITIRRVLPNGDYQNIPISYFEK